jgi:tetratricopeptide (TPR) repeat protein
MSAEPSPKTLGSLADDADPMVTLAEVLLDRAHADDPAFAELINVAAVPRKFDIDLLAHLVGSSPDEAAFRRRFESLRVQPYVTIRRDGRLRMHNEIRRALLARSESTEEGREALRASRERVATYYDAEHERARHLSDELAVVDEVLREVSPHRMPAIRAACEDRLIRPLIEAQHHRTVIDAPGTGFQHFEQTFWRYEVENRQNVLRMLLTAFQTDIGRLQPPAGDEKADAFRRLDQWLEYYWARLRAIERDHEEVLSICRRLLDDPELDPRLAAWSRALVSKVHIAAGRFRPALDSIATELAARVDPDPDALNSPLVHLRAADVHAILWDPEAQEASLISALEAARKVANTPVEISTRFQLAIVLARRSDMAGAAEHAVLAMHDVRTSSQASAEDLWECAHQLMTTFGGRDPRLADVFHAEARTLVRGDPIKTVTTATAYADVLAATAQYDRAHEAIDALAGIAADLRYDQKSTIDISLANLLDAEGREHEAVERNRMTVREARGQPEDPWTVAAALTNAAMTEMLLGELLDDASRSAAEGRALWARMDHERGVRLTDTVQAEVHRRRGQYADADALLTRDPPPARSDALLLWYEVRAELDLDLGRLTDAADNLSTVIDEQIRLGQLSGAATSAARAMQVNMRAGRRPAAQRHAEQQGALMQTLAEQWSYRYSPDQDRADQHNARAVRALCVSESRPEHALREAVQNLDEAIKLDPTLCWYPFNLAYAYARLGDRKSAHRAFRKAAALAAEPFATAIGRLDDVFKDWSPKAVR